MKILILSLLFPFLAQAKIEVAFLELRSGSGELVQLERNGRFAHIAISVGNQWLHSHPYRGVEFISENELKEMGQAYFFEFDSERTLSQKDLVQYLGKPYDNFYSWTGEALYCSELVGKILGIRPKPMNFDAPIWKGRFKFKKGELGLSPDDIYQELTAK